MKMVVRLAMRSILRNRFRSVLAISGIAVATMMLIFNVSFMESFYDLMIRGSTDVEIGHVQIQDRDYIDRPATIDYMEWDEELREAVEALPEVRAATPRVRLFGLVGHEDRSFVGRIFGIDPVTEPDVTVMSEGIVEGRWLSETNREPPAEVVIGRGLSRTLGVGLGGELVVIAEGADGSMGDALLEVVGILETGNSVVDRQAVLLHIDEAQYVAAMEGVVHEVIISVHDPAGSMAAAGAVQSVLDARGLEDLQARSWMEVQPGLYELLVLGNTSNYIIYLVIFFIVALGVLNALRMSARERYREFGVMMAVGMSRAKLFSMIVFEGLVLGITGAGVGALIGGAGIYYFSKYGLDLGMLMEGEGTYMGVSFSDRIFFVTSPELVLEPSVGLVVVTVVCAIWPAVAAIRLLPRDAITGRQ